MLLLRQRLLAVFGAVLLDRGIQRVPVIRTRLGDHRRVVAVLVGVGLQVCRVGIEHGAIDQSLGNGLLHDCIEDGLRNARIVVAPPPVLAQRRGVKHRIGQLQPQKPAVGNVDFDLANQLPFRAHPEQVANKQGLEHHRRIERRPSVVRAIKPGNPIMDKGKIDHRVDLAKQVILRNQTVETYHLQCGLLR